MNRIELPRMELLSTEKYSALRCLPKLLVTGLLCLGAVLPAAAQQRTMLPCTGSNPRLAAPCRRFNPRLAAHDAEPLVVGSCPDAEPLVA